MAYDADLYIGGIMITKQRRRVKISGTGWGLLASVAVGLFLGREESLLWLCFLAAVSVHEAGHLLMAWLCGVGIEGIRLDLFGARLSLTGMVSYGKEFLIVLGGPLANFLSAVLVFGFFQDSVLLGEGAVGAFFASSVALGVFNFLPVGTMDGGRLLTAMLSRLFGHRVAYVCLKMTTAIFLACLWLFSVYALLMGRGMISLFVFSFCLLVRLLSPEPSDV